MKFTKSNFVRNLAQGRLLVPYLEKFDEYDRPFEFKYEPKEGDDAWHPSGDCTPSVISLYAKASGALEKEVHSPGLQKAFLVGHFWHQVIQNVLVKMDFAAPESIERRGFRNWGCNEISSRWDEAFPPYHWATGSGDVAPLVLPKWEGILDIKTMRSGDFKQVARSGLLPERFAAKYECQINIYMDFFDQPEGMILGVNKDSPHDFCEVVFERNQELIDTIYSKWMFVSDCLGCGKTPLPDTDDIFELPLQGPIS